MDRTRPMATVKGHIMSRFVIRLQVGAKTHEFVRLAYTAHKLRQIVEHNYPGVEVLDVYKL